MSDDIKPAMLNEGQAQGQRSNDNIESLPLDTDSIEGVTGSGGDTSQPDGNPVGEARREDVEGGHTQTPSPDIEADAGADPQAPNRKGEG